MFLDYYNIGGIEKVINDLKLNLNNYQIDILTFVNKSNNKTIISLLKKNYRNFFLRNILSLNKLKKYLKNNNYDIIHIHCYNAFGLIYARIASKYIKKVIIHAHNTNIDNDKFKIKLLINNLIKKIYKNNNYIYIAPTINCSKFCFNKKSLIIPNSIDYNKYYQNNKDRIKYRNLFNIDKKDIVIGHIGRFESQKNHEFIIDIFNDINKLKNNYKLILIGEGNLLNKIKDKVNNLNLNNKVIFLNNRLDIPNLINMFDIYLFPSLYEGFPISVIEQQVNNKDVYVSDKLDKFITISNKIHFISLNKTSLEWAKIIINNKNNKLILNNKLDIHNYVKKIEGIYKK